ncbi:hypothetical protein BP6252_04031 [Coleophoma cylindrospora]|uniref:MARVEL domain-containing protein n=1 Tax=Coleophoma cylindrospora TaxID=1849047 RepID=A0A3D8RZB8_9HELO|nr:hypothetical protein BP6252_04031 [Coleophoma cylindrospora]
MAYDSENTPFLAETDHGDDYEDGETYSSKSTPANTHFKRPLRIVKSVVTLLSLLTTVLVVVCFIFVQNGPFEYIWSTKAHLLSLGIVLFVNFLLSLPAVVLQLPILINLAIEIAMSIVTMVYAGRLFGNGWPDSSFCRRWNRDEARWTPLPDTPECVESRDVIRIMVGVAGGVSIIMGLMILAMLLLRLVALARTKFWEGKNFGAFHGPWISPGTYTVQFTMSIVKKDPNGENIGVKGKVADRQSEGQASQLIET